MYYLDGRIFTNAGAAAWGAAYTTGDIISTALDMTNGKVWWAKNGTWQASGDPAAGTNPAYSSLTGTLMNEYGCANTTGNTITGNWGASAFAYTTTSGFGAWTA